MNTNLVFLDTETTGNDFLQDFLFEVCYKFNGKIISQLFKPPIPISIKAQSITHITNKMVTDKPKFKTSKMKKDLQILLKDNILVAHNARFDISMLIKEGLEISNFICTLKVARFLDEQNLIPEYNLQYLRYYYELDVKASSHDAKSDVLVLESLFNKLYDLMFSRYKNKDSVIKKMMEVSSKPFLIKLFNFGKHKGKTIEEVLIVDKNYLEWLLLQKEQSNFDEDDWIYTLKHHLKITYAKQ